MPDLQVSHVPFAFLFLAFRAFSGVLAKSKVSPPAFLDLAELPAVEGSDAPRGRELLGGLGHGELHGGRGAKWRASRRLGGLGGAELGRMARVEVN